MDRHQCEKKHGPIWEVMEDGAGALFCCGCGQDLNPEQIHPSVLRKSRRYRDEHQEQKGRHKRKN